jgi:hypothetical protein
MWYCNEQRNVDESEQKKRFERMNDQQVTSRRGAGDERTWKVGSGRQYGGQVVDGKTAGECGTGFSKTSV